MVTLPSVVAKFGRRLPSFGWISDLLVAGSLATIVRGNAEIAAGNALTRIFPAVFAVPAAAIATFDVRVERLLHA